MVCQDYEASMRGKQRKFVGLIVASALFISSGFLPWQSMRATAQTVNLPLDVQLDIAIAELQRALESDQHDRIIEIIDRIRAIDPSADSISDILFFESEAELALDNFDRAEQALTRFLTLRGRSSPNYDNAISMMLEMSELREARERELRRQEAEAERRRAQEEAARQAREAEQRRREQEVAELREQRRLRDAENGLGLSAREWVHIRLVLNTRYGDPQSGIYSRRGLTAQERNYLRFYDRSKGFQYTGFLDRARADALLAEDLIPASSLQFSFARNSRKQITIGDWNGIVSSDGACVIETTGTVLGDGLIFVTPILRISYNSGWGIAAFDFDLATPNPFLGRQLTARVGVENFPLIHESRQIRPNLMPDGESYDYSVIRALVNADFIDITGRNRLYSDDLIIRFNVKRFHDAIKFMSHECDEPHLLNLIESRSFDRDVNENFNLYLNREEIDDGNCFIVIASRRERNEVVDFVRNLSAENYYRARVFLNENGWHAISIGNTPQKDAADIISYEIRQNHIPNDSFCTEGTNLTRELSREYYAESTINYSATHRVISPNTGYLNLRAGPGVSFSIIDRLQHESLLQVTAESRSGWVRVRLQNGLRGWVSTSFIQRI
jgi:hypothetical protein